MTIRRMKYVILDGIFPVIFPEMSNHSHADVAEAFSFDGKPTSAGFCHINAEGQVSCYGQSVSLKVVSDPDADSKLINKHFGIVALTLPT